MMLSTGDVIHLRPPGNATEFRYYIEANSAKYCESLLTKAINYLG